MKTLFDDFENVSPDPKYPWTSKYLNPISIIVYCVVFFFIFVFFVQSPIMALIMSLIFFIALIQGIRQSKIRKAVCEKNGWQSDICAPRALSVLRENFKTLPVGTPSLDQEILGKLKDETFYMSRFSATTGSGKSRRTVTVRVLAFKLEREIPFKFSIVQEGFFSSSDDIQVESIDFNEKFEIKYDLTSKQEVMKLLTPSLQNHLLDLNKLIKVRGVEVVENVLLITHQKDVLSSFGLTTNVSESQIARINEKLNQLLAFSDEISDIFDRHR